MTFDPATATLADFEPLVGETFIVSDNAGGRAELKLHGAKYVGGEALRDRKVVVGDTEIPARRAFALSFMGPPEPTIELGTYLFEHAATGQFAMMIGLFDQDADASFYEAVWS
ncbi:MAG: hypothetical protein AAGP08_02330 [Pseudomonadota bacterium]